MSYWSVGSKNETLPLYVWADNAQHAQRKIEAMFGPFANGQAVVKQMPSVPAAFEVFDEPENEREERQEEDLDG